MVWWILYALAGIALLIHWRGPNPVWGGVTIGGLASVVVVIVALITGGSYWWLIPRIIAVSILLGAGNYWLVRLGDQSKNSDPKR
jgi:hypothetical protein